MPTTHLILVSRQFSAYAFSVFFRAQSVGVTADNKEFITSPANDGV